MPLLNLTPHEVTVFADGTRVVRRYPAAARPVRVPVTRVCVGLVDGVPLVRQYYGRAALPEVCPGTWYIVSALVAAAHPERRDLLVPTDLVRAADGTVIGCRALDCHPGGEGVRRTVHDDGDADGTTEPWPG
ncbi:hypothetical protein NI17_012335 [Thermobifida halotolerans]|uniref:Uncharacterized protein n=1 Tax=Thermobifida halotolerans TaxID=483545 RepID=A0AA97LTC7_9ACTN|nr:hypothetical protein [Thermobifida halotolerans]UOE17700.1 hypothetical protein NI17_012335 [Thermobifida halotolerans]